MNKSDQFLRWVLLCSFRCLALCGVLWFPIGALAGGTITNCTDANLRAALTGGGEVVFACSGVVTLTNTLAISTDTVISANGYSVTIDGGNAVRIFTVTTNVNFGVRGLTLANGFVVGPRGIDGTFDGINTTPATPGGDGFGAGILSQGGRVTLIGCALTNCVASGGHAGEPQAPHPETGGAGFGGAICNLGGIVNLTNCVIGGSLAAGGSGSESWRFMVDSTGDGGSASGGAIYSEAGTLNLENLKLLGNSAIGGAATEGRGGDGAGGGIFISNSSVLISQSLVLSNTVLGGPCTNDPSGSNPGWGGYGLGGAFYLSSNSLVGLRLCSFSADAATGGDGTPYKSAGVGKGGAIYDSGNLEVWGCTFSDNQSAGGNLFLSPPAVGQGGAIYSINMLVVNSSTFAGNSAIGGEASGFRINFNPGATGDGGAIWSSGGLWATNSTFTANSAAGGVVIPPQGAGGNGGGISLSGGSASLVHLTIVGNRADGWVGMQDSPPAHGGGLSATNTTVTIRGSIIANSGYGGEVWGTLTDAGYNICSDASAKFSAVGSLNNAEPLLGPLASNGGPTPTMVLLSGSIGRDAIPSDFPPVDQRGIVRPQGPAADIGAAEGDPVGDVPTHLTIRPSGTNLSLSFTAEEGRTYRLLRSTNLSDWLSVATNSALSSGTLNFTQPATVNSRLFFRLLLP